MVSRSREKMNLVCKMELCKDRISINNTLFQVSNRLPLFKI